MKYRSCMASARRIFQKNVLSTMAGYVKKAILSERVYTVARQMTSGCDSKDDMCELQAIFDSVKYGNENVRTKSGRSYMEKGLRYVADPTIGDFHVVPEKMLAQCEMGACAEDCDSHAMLIAALCGSIGFRVGLRGYGPSVKGPLTHVYAVVLAPKAVRVDDLGNPVQGADQLIGMDSTVKQSSLGWEPPPGAVITAWIWHDKIQMIAGDVR